MGAKPKLAEAIKEGVESGLLTKNEKWRETREIASVFDRISEAVGSARPGDHITGVFAVVPFYPPKGKKEYRVKPGYAIVRRRNEL